MAALPLQGLRVLDLTRNVAGPYAAMILGELGAEVVKVEHPGRGDDTRQWGPPFVGGDGPIYLAMNRNKRSVTIDLGARAARPIMERLCDASDVLVESFRPGSLDRMGYGPAWAAGRNPRLIYCSITPYGDGGPLRDRPGYDPLMQAFAGIMAMTGEPGGKPVRAGVSIVDMGTGMWAAIAILAALRRREATGRGERIVTALYETALAWMAYHLTTHWAGGETRRHGSGTSTIAPYEAFATADGDLMIAAGNDALFGRLCEALGQGALAADGRFRGNADRVRNRDALHAALEAATSGWPTALLADALVAAGVPCSPIRGVPEVAADPQAAALGIFQRHADLGEVPSVGLPVRLGGERPPLRLAPPARGEHNRAVLADLGFSADEAEGLLASDAMTASAGG
jgi:crotonobetainyl-CoA:carnitine CoA-transferase CaiB-like acyl-CoA transferase